MVFKDELKILSQDPIGFTSNEETKELNQLLAEMSAEDKELDESGTVEFNI